jgi:DNA end-binding protein Ku
MMQPFKAAQYHDEFQDRLRKLVEAKRRGQTVEVQEAAKRAPVIDMMEALKKSLASRPTSEAETKKLPAKRRKVAVKVKKAS